MRMVLLISIRCIFSLRDYTQAAFHMGPISAPVEPKCDPNGAQMEPIWECCLGSPYSTKKTCLFWLPNVNEIDTNYLKCTRAMQAPMRGDPTRPIFHLLALGVVLGQRCFVLSQQCFAFGPGGFSDTNMLVFPKQNSHVGV